jgi:phage terminase large subunit GpA-like protein
MDCCSDPLVEQVTCMFAAQVGKTEGMINNTLGYYMDQDPSPILAVFESEEKAEAWSKERLVPMLMDTPCLASKIQVGKGPDSANTITYKDFPGGYLAIAGAGSEADLSSRPIRILLKDEIDKWKIIKAGDPDSLADKRTSTFFNRKIIEVSTPRDHDPPDMTSRVLTKYEASDMRRYHVPCPFCKHEQVLREGQLDFDKHPDGTYGDKVTYLCEKCGWKIDHRYKRSMLSAGRWIAEKEFNGHAGFWISALYSPWVTWKEYRDAFRKSKSQRDTYKTFVNEWRAEPWKAQMETDKDISVYTKRCESYDKVPVGAALGTAFCDIQADRIEVEVRFWGEGRQSWGMEHKIFYGEPNKLTTGHLPKVWEDLDIYLSQMWEHESGEMLRLSRVFVDMGYLQSEVWKFCRPRRGKGIYPSKGMSDPRAPIVSKRPVKTRDRVIYFPIGPNEAKDIIFSNMELAEDGPGRMHFAKGKYDDEFFKQLLTSERYKWVKGAKVYEKISTSSRNEALDLAVGNLAAFESMAVDPKPYVDALRRRWEENQKAEKEAADKGTRGQGEESETQNSELETENSTPKRRGGWVKGWKR